MAARLSLPSGRMCNRGFAALAFAVLGLLVAPWASADARTALRAQDAEEGRSAPAATQVSGRDAQIVVDADTLEVLYERNAAAPRRPASITKVMTLYLLFEAIERGEIGMDDPIAFSAHAAGQAPTKLGLRAGESVPVHVAIRALALRSANDVASAVAERLAGSEAAFAERMTARARALGMTATRFTNASGLPDSRQVSTAEDLARLAIAVHRDFPQHYHVFSEREYAWNGMVLRSHNHLLGRVRGLDGLKTGFTRASGFNLAATAERGGRRVVTVVLGGSSRVARDDLVEALTETAFTEINRAPAYAVTRSPHGARLSDSRDTADAAGLVMDVAARPESEPDPTLWQDNGRRLALSGDGPAGRVSGVASREAAAASRALRADAEARDQARRDAVTLAEAEAARRRSQADARREQERLRLVAEREARARDARAVAAADEESRQAAASRRTATRLAANAEIAAPAAGRTRSSQSANASAEAGANARPRQSGAAVVQIGAFRSEADARAALSRFARHFPSAAGREVTSVRRDGRTWYRARFVGLAAGAAETACRVVSGRGGACQIVSR